MKFLVDAIAKNGYSSPKVYQIESVNVYSTVQPLI